MAHSPEIIKARMQHPTTSLMKRDYLAMEPMLVWLRSIAVAHVGGKLLDYGCGNRPYLSFFQHAIDSYTGVDVSQNESGTVDIVLAAGARLPLADASFDTVLSTQVLEHVSEPDAYLAEASRVLRPGGCLILTCPGSYMLHEEPHDFFRYTIYGLRHLLEKNGLEPLRMDQAGGAWRLIGQTFLNQMAFGRKYKVPIVSSITYRAWVLSCNILFSFLDRVNTNEKDTVNYMVVARKR